MIRPRSGAVNSPPRSRNSGPSPLSSRRQSRKQPIIDTPAFLPCTPFVCRINGKNPNRFFPGDPNGTFTEVVGDVVRQGQSIGRIGNLYGDTLATIEAPHEGVILFITSAPAMPHDGLMIAVGGT